MLSNIASWFRAQRRRSKGKKASPLISNKHAQKVVRRAHAAAFPTWKQLRHISKLLSQQEKVTLRIASIILLFSVVWVGIFTTSQYRQSVPAVGGRYVEAVVGTPEAINPLFASLNDVDRDLVQLMYAGLMHYDNNQQLQPDLASAYTVSEDKTVYTFTLRDNLFWHDGEPITADDILFTFDLIQNEQVNSPLFFSFQGVTVTVIDEQTVQFALQEPFQPFLASLTVGILPAHIWETIPAEQLRLAKPNLQPIGSGPFRFARLAKDDTGFVFQYELERFEQYHHQAPYIEEFVFQFFGEYETELGAIQALRQGKVDGLHFVPANLRDKVTRKHIDIHTLQLPQYSALFMNQKKNTALEEKDVRQALSYALDKDRILRESLQGDGQVIYSPILPGFPGYKEDIEKTPYNLSQANDLLDENWSRLSVEDYREKRRQLLMDQYGISTSTVETAAEDTDTASSTEEVVEEVPVVEENNSSTEDVMAIIEQRLDAEIPDTQLFYRQNDNEDLLTIDLVTAETAEYRQAAQLIAGFWQDLGITTNITYIAPRDISREALRDRDYDVLLYGVIVGSDPDQYPFWHSSQVAYPGLNLAQYVNRSVDELLEKARESAETTEIDSLYAQFQDKILADQPVIFLYTPIYRYATSDDVKGVNASRIFHPADRFAGVTDWYIKTKGDWSFRKK